jgi:hypothetical protein
MKIATALVYLIIIWIRESNQARTSRLSREFMRDMSDTLLGHHNP